MKIIAFSRVHYGKDYLAQVIQSALPFVDKFVVLYTPTPTFGRFTDMPCPDNHDVLFWLAMAVAGKKLDWREGLPMRPETIWGLYPDVDMVLELDADEIIEPMLFEQLIHDFEAGKLTHYNYRLPFRHHWRSFNYVCQDASWPIRLYLPNNAKEEAVYYENTVGFVHHFGYARALGDMRYKWETSVHIGELRSDWWTSIWGNFPNRLTDLHPVCFDFWKAEPYNRFNLPNFMHNHLYFDREVIE